MTQQPTLMLIADIAGYTRFMRFHQASLAHAQEIVARLLEVVIDAAGPSLRLAKLEGDAAFFYMTAARDGTMDPSVIASHAADIYRAFHARAADFQVNTLCPCDGCQQAGNLKIKLVGHVGDVAMQKVKQMTELAGIDVIVVHRMLKNTVPVPEYLLMTKPVHAMLASPLLPPSISFSMTSARRPRITSTSPTASIPSPRHASCHRGAGWSAT
jgi:class 3 adenylate cyclase